MLLRNSFCIFAEILLYVRYYSFELLQIMLAPKEAGSGGFVPLPAATAGIDLAELEYMKLAVSSLLVVESLCSFL